MAAWLGECCYVAVQVECYGTPPPADRRVRAFANKTRAAEVRADMSRTRLLTTSSVLINDLTFRRLSMRVRRSSEKPFCKRWQRQHGADASRAQVKATACCASRLCISDHRCYFTRSGSSSSSTGCVARKHQRVGQRLCRLDARSTWRASRNLRRQTPAARPSLPVAAYAAVARTNLHAATNLVRCTLLRDSRATCKQAPAQVEAPAHHKRRRSPGCKRQLRARGTATRRLSTSASALRTAARNALQATSSSRSNR